MKKMLSKENVFKIICKNSYYSRKTLLLLQSIYIPLIKPKPMNWKWRVWRMEEKSSVAN
jgi:hypothetical protein